MKCRRASALLCVTSERTSPAVMRFSTNNEKQNQIRRKKNERKKAMEESDVTLDRVPLGNCEQGGGQGTVADKGIRSFFLVLV